MKLKSIILGVIIICNFCISRYTYASMDNRADSIHTMLDSLSAKLPALKDKVDISLNNLSIQELVLALTKNSGVNINIDPDLNIKVSNNFTNIEVIDVLTFIAYQYNLEVDVIGSVISLYQTEKIEKKVPSVSRVKYTAESDVLTIDYQNTNLDQVLREITQASGKNIIPSPGISTQKVSGYIQNQQFNKALENFCFANNLDVEESEGTYIVSAKPQAQKTQPSQSSQSSRDSRRSRQQPSQESSQDGEIQFSAKSIDSISVYAVDYSIMEVIKEVSNYLNINYFISDDIQGEITLNVRDISYEELLSVLFVGSEYMFLREGNIYIVGEQKTQNLQEFRVIQIQNRTIDGIIDILPQDLTIDIDIQEFPDLNSLLIGGPTYRIDKINAFIKQIDKIVPVVLIEIILIDFNKSSNISTGINAGLGDNPNQTAGTLFPNIDVELSSKSINEVIEKLDDLPFINLGKVVSPQFYASLKLLESQGVLNVRSTPKLATLNGYEATLNIGNTEYYLEEKSELVGTQVPTQVKTTTYTNVEASLDVSILPIVSGDEQITLEISVSQSDFTERISKFAPPGKVNRDFKSTIRVKNQEMILLGGLEEKRTSDSGSGLPLLSRIPVVKWIFSSKSREDSKSKLNIFIKPTIY